MPVTCPPTCCCVHGVAGAPMPDPQGGQQYVFTRLLFSYVAGEAVAMHAGYAGENGCSVGGSIAQ
eukprot:326788-Chlamydomonas_euryale.AAC.1